MDIEYLLVLQQIREGFGGIFTDFLVKMSFLGLMNTSLVILAALYWCVSKEFGTYLMMGFAYNRVANGLLKVSACVYRPWIRDPRVIPHAGELELATGYSFPSGHSMNAATVYGGGAVRKDLPKALRIALATLVVLIAFSRNFVGVHTPQDVLVGVTIGLLVMVLTQKLLVWVNAHPDKDWIVAVVGIAIAVLVAVFAALKPYPVDYDAAGNLVVDGTVMANDTYKGAGWCAAFLVGWLLERRHVKFSTDVCMVRRVTRLVIGLLSHYAVTLILMPQIKAVIAGPAGTFTSCFVQMFFITFIFPWLLVRFEKPESQN